MKSKIGFIDGNDLLKGLLVAVLSAFVTGLYNALELGTIEFTWVFFKPIVMTSIAAGLAYIIKNWLSNSEGQFLKK